MKLTFSCTNCGREYSADASNAGRRARCKQCGEAMTVPAETDLIPLAEEPASPDPAARSAEAPIRGPQRMGANVFVSSRAEGESAPRRRKKRKNFDTDMERAGEEFRGFAARNAKLGAWILAIAVVVAVALFVVARSIPNGTIVAGLSLAAIGLLMMLVGFGVGAYAAFCEDFLNGMLYLFIPIYTAYYLVSNWDEMWRWFLIMTAGAGLILMATSIMSAGVEQADKEKRQRQSQSTQLLKPLRLTVISSRATEGI
jgi:hypothetical protein